VILRKCALVVCLLAGFMVPLHSQVNSQPIEQAGQVHLDLCLPGSHCVDLCKLAAQLDTPDKNDAATMALEAPKGHQHRLHVHDDILLSYDKKEQIIWFCSTGKGFQITQIHKVIRKECDVNGPDMPFDLKVHANLRTSQSAGAQLASGPPVAGTAGHWYKFTFIIAGKTPPDSRRNARPNYDPLDPPLLIVGKLYDPHIIVTGPGDTGREGNPCPHPSPSPHKDGKASSQKGGKAQ